MAQTAYNSFPPAARAGLRYDTGPVDVITGQAAVLIPFGSFLVKAAGDGNVALPSAAPNASPGGSILAGVAMYDQDTQSGLSTDGITPGYATPYPINIMRKGRIWVFCETGYNPDTDNLYVRYTANGALVPGNVRNTADSGKAALLGAGGWLVGYTPLNTLTASGFLALDLNFPNTVR